MLASYSGPTMAPETTSADAFARPGALMEYLHATYGVQVYRYLRNHSASPLAVGVCTDFEADSAVDVELCAANAMRYNQGGIPQNVVPAGEYFWGLVRGRGQVLSNAAITQGALVKCAAATGKVDDAALTVDSGEYVGRALVAATGADELIDTDVFILGG
jgi:hypothetical protein